jgi:hypothetical protein
MDSIRMDERDRNTFLQQYRDIIRYIMTHRKVIKYINFISIWTTVVGFLSSATLGFEIIMDGVPPEKQKVVYGTLAFASAATTVIKESPWIQKRLKNQHKLLTELRGWQSQYYSAARKYFETNNIEYIKDIKEEYEENEDDLLNREGNEDVTLGGRLMNIFFRTKPANFEEQYKVKYRRVSSFIVNDSESVRTSSDSPEDDLRIRKGFSEEIIPSRHGPFSTIKEEP